jgi:ribulose 1,5-bisphosphate synthetase/thiazole synthase
VDVAVVGGGAAGICAAVAAARNGANTLLIEASAYLVGYICSGPGSTPSGISFQDTDKNHIIKGIPWEMMERLVKAGDAIPQMEREVISDIPFMHTPYGTYGPILDLEAVKTLALEMVEESGAGLLLHTFAAGVVAADGAISGVVIESKSGRQAVLAKVVVDCSGDGDVAAFAGAPFEKAPRDELFQMSNSLHLVNVDTKVVKEEAERILKEHGDELAYMIKPKELDRIPSRWQAPLVAALHGPEGGVKMTPDGKGLTGKRRSVGWGPRPGMGGVGADYEGDATDIEDLTRAEVRTRKDIWRKLGDVRRSKAGFANCIAMASSLPLGIRETRRITGAYVLTGDDVQFGRKFDDSITKSADPIDGHLPGGGWDYHQVEGYHDIPYRCLVPQSIENLLVAGRCISADHRAESAIRKVPPCMATGQAAGTAAALSVRNKVTPRKLDVELLQKTLREQGA